MRRVKAVNSTALLVLFTLQIRPLPAQGDSTFVPQIGALVQFDVVAVTDPHPDDGFTLRAARLRLNGGVRSLQYFSQGDFTRDDVLLDARVAIRPTSSFSLHAGIFKSPFSAEYLTYRGDLALAERARAVRALVPGRQIGLSTQASTGAVAVHAGVFNGNGGESLKRGRPGILGVGRIVHNISLGDRSGIRLGVSFSYGMDRKTDLYGLMLDFDGLQRLIGLDAAFDWSRVVAEIEGVTSKLESENQTNRSYSPWGGAVTLGYRISDRQRLSVRYDRYDTDGLSYPRERDVFVLGYRLTVDPLVDLMLNYSTKPNGQSEPRMLIRCQFSKP